MSFMTIAQPQGGPKRARIPIVRALTAIALPGLVLALPSFLLSVAAGSGRTVSHSSETQVSTPQRSGRYWAIKETGFQSLEAGGALHVSTIGSVSVEGGNEPLVRYTLVKKVEASNEAEARRLFAQYRLDTAKDGNTVVLKLAHGGTGRGGAELILTVPRGIAIAEVMTHGGSVEASGIDGKLLVQTGGGEVDLDKIGGDVVARTAGGEITLGDIGGTLRCTTAGGSITAKSVGRDAAMETGGGDIEVTKVGGSVRASTAGGGVRIGRTGGLVVASTAGGAIEIERSGGAVVANSLGGPIGVGAADGVTVESAGGGIRLRQVSGRLRASTAVGDIFAGMVGRPAGESLLTTGSGDITVVIPRNLAITVRAENSSPDRVRRIVSDFPGIQIKTVGPIAFAEGKLHGGGPLLRLASAGGTIYIKQEESGTNTK